MPTDQERLKARAFKKKLFRRLPEPEDVAYLNITAMMDMMTIILVFFLKNYAVTTTNINVGSELTPPESSTKIAAHGSLPVTVSEAAIMVEDKVVATVKRGRVDASAKRGGENDLIITSLLDELTQHARRLKKIEEIGGQPFKHEITIICHRAIPFRLLSEVIYTAGEAEFGRYRLLVITPEELG